MKVTVELTIDPLGLNKASVINVLKSQDPFLRGAGHVEIEIEHVEVKRVQLTDEEQEREP